MPVSGGLITSIFGGKVKAALQSVTKFTWTRLLQDGLRAATYSFSMSRRLKHVTLRHSSNRPFLQLTVKIKLKGCMFLPRKGCGVTTRIKDTQLVLSHNMQTACILNLKVALNASKSHL